MKRHLLTIGCLIAALLCYAIGFGGGVVAFAAVGVILECIFWFRLLKRRRQPS